MLVSLSIQSGLLKSTHFSTQQALLKVSGEGGKTALCGLSVVSALPGLVAFAHVTDATPNTSWGFVLFMV